MWPWPLTPISYQWSKTFFIIYTPSASIVLNINTLYQKLKDEFELRITRQTLGLSDPDLWLQGHTSNLKPPMQSTNHKTWSHCTKYMKYEQPR